MRPRAQLETSSKMGEPVEEPMGEPKAQLETKRQNERARGAREKESQKSCARCTVRAESLCGCCSGIVRLLFGHCAEGLSGRPLGPQGLRESVQRPVLFCYVLGSVMHCAALCGTMLLHKGPAQCTVRAESLCTLCVRSCFRKKNIVHIVRVFFLGDYFFFL